MRKWVDVSTSPDQGSRTVQIGDLTIHDINFPAVVAEIVRLASDRAGGYVCTPNADYVVRARRDRGFRHAVEGARLRVPDGMWIVYASRIAGRPLGTTVTGRLLLPAVSAAAATMALRVALVGAGPGVAALAGERLRRAYSGLDVTATITPPSPFGIGSNDDAELCGKLKIGNPDVIFVALGAPKQEIWMQRHTHEFGGAVLIGVGAAFDILAGRFREAPRWMTRWGFEWLYRLAQEPRRLARRYLIDDLWILWWAVKTRIGTRGPS